MDLLKLKYTFKVNNCIKEEHLDFEDFHGSN